MAEEKLTPEQQKEMAEKNAKAAKINLGDETMWNYALSKFATPEQYGALAKSTEGLYAEAISKVPNENAYQQIFLRGLMGEGGNVSNDYIKNTSAQIIQESAVMSLVKDLAKSMGIEGKLDAKYEGKTVSQLDKEEVGQFVGSYIQYQVDGKMKKVLEMRQKAIAGGLEELVGFKEEQKN